MNHVENLKTIIQNNPKMMTALEKVQQMKLPGGCISAGFIRNLIWDVKHGYEKMTPVNDVDVLYYDPADIHKRTEKIHEQKLFKMEPALPWSVKNEARMHLRNGDAPYHSVEDAMRHWAETATAVAVRLNENEKLSIIAPFGLDDLFELKLREGPFVKDKKAFQRRCSEKNWLEKWPLLRVVSD